MDVEENDRSCEHNERSLSSITNAKINKFIVKHDFDTATQMLKSDSLLMYVNKRETSKLVNYNKNESSDRSDRDSDADERENCSYRNRNDIPDDSFNSCKTYDCGLGCSKNIQVFNNDLAQSQNRVTFQKEEHGQSSNNIRSVPLNKLCDEKATYCRPVNNMYTNEFVNKTIEKNIKLQKLLKKIVLARQQEKEKEQWNNYVNELKNKHSYYSNEPRYISPQYVPQESMYPKPNTYYTTRFTWNDSKQCGNLLHAIYGNDDAPSYEYYYPSEYERACENPGLSNVYANDQCCYPTSSQGRFMMLHRKGSNIPCHTKSNRFAPPIVVDKDYSQNKNHFEGKLTPTLEDCGCSPIGEIKSIFEKKAVQTEGVTSSSKQVGETVREKYEQVTENVNKLKEKIETNEQKMQRKSSLKNIEKKLDELVKSLNNFMAEIKSRKDTRSPSLSPLNSIPSSENSRESSLHQRKSGSFGINRKPVTIIGNATTNTPASAVQLFGNSRLRHAVASTRIDTILHEEIAKSNELRREIEELLPTQKKPCVQTSFDIPTKERATEVTQSLSKTKLSNGDSKVTEVIEEIRAPNREHDRRMTIAVNTDPLGLLALFRVSSEAIKQLMSYVDYNWYLSRLPLPQIARRGVLDYVCNICGANFARPSQLSDHIQRHNLGNSKDCCVCRHALDSTLRSTTLFGCQYCGQVFTRAYCCELHQQSCARRLGKRHDVSSSLMLLT